MEEAEHSFGEGQGSGTPQHPEQTGDRLPCTPTSFRESNLRLHLPGHKQCCLGPQMQAVSDSAPKQAKPLRVPHVCVCGHRNVSGAKCEHVGGLVTLGSLPLLRPQLDVTATEGHSLQEPRHQEKVRELDILPAKAPSQNPSPSPPRPRSAGSWAPAGILPSA